MSGRTGHDRDVRLSALPSCPATPAALWLCLGILVVLLPVRWPAWNAISVAAGAVSSVGLWLAFPRSLKRLCVFFPLGVSLTALHAWAPWQTYRRHLPRAECGAEIQAIAANAGYMGESLAWLGSSSRVIARVRAVRFAPDEAWTRCHGKIVVVLPDGCAFAYGSHLHARGAFIRPERGPAGAFDYRQYLHNLGVRHVFSVREVVARSDATEWRRLLAALYLVRDVLAEHLASSSRSDTNTQVLLAMTLGYRYGLDPATRAKFLRSGAVHLFAISGLHVGIVGTISLLCLRVLRVSFRLRCRALPLLLGLYVVATGATDSAVRAWLMLSIWCINRSAFRPTVPLNAVSVAALVLLVVNPLDLMQAGFQFSFVIVLVLVLGWRLVSRVVATVEERDRWVPLRSRRRGMVRYVRRRAMQLGGGGVLAWFGSAGLILWTNSLLIPAAIVVNIGVSFLAWLVLFLAAPKMVVSLLPGGLTWLNSAVAYVMDMLLNGIQILVQTGSTYPGSVAVPRPSLWVVVLYYVSLLLCLLPSSGRRLRAAGIAITVGVLVAASLVQPQADHTVTVITAPDTNVPVIVLGASRPLGPTIISTGGPQTARVTAALLRARGYDTIDELILPSGRWGDAAGTNVLLNSFAVRALTLPARSHRTDALQQAEQRHQQKHGKTQYMKRVTAQSSTRADWLSETPERLLACRNADGMRRLEFQRDLPYVIAALEVNLWETGDTEILCRSAEGELTTLRLRPSLRRRIVDLTPDCGQNLTRVAQRILGGDRSRQAQSTERRD